MNTDIGVSALVGDIRRNVSSREFNRNFQHMSSNPALIGPAYNQIVGGARHRLSVKHLCSNPNATRLVNNLDGSEPWAQIGRNDNIIHYFWLSENYHPDVYEMLVAQLNVHEDGDRGLAVWRSQLCKNPNPEVVELVIDLLRDIPNDSELLKYDIGVHTPQKII